MFWVGFIFIALLLLILPTSVVEYWRQFRKVSDGVRNYDPYMTRFMYHVPYSVEEAWNRLGTRGHAAAMSYTVQPDQYSIDIADEIGKLSYWLILQEADGGCRLTVELKSCNGNNRSTIHVYLNDFWQAVLQASPVPYTYY